MPTNRRRASRTRIDRNGVPDHIFHAFSSGGGWMFGDDDGWKDQQTEADLRKAWKKYKPAIMTRDMEEDRAWGIVGRRSWAYFEYDLEPPHPRLVVGKETYHPPYGDGPVERPNGKGVYETDLQYLSRLGLLYEWETEALQRAYVHNTEATGNE